jgi:hypothetical protein
MYFCQFNNTLINGVQIRPERMAHHQVISKLIDIILDILAKTNVG